MARTYYGRMGREFKEEKIPTAPLLGNREAFITGLAS
jgi:hypothetical protein